MYYRYKMSCGVLLLAAYCGFCSAQAIKSQKKQVEIYTTAQNTAYRLSHTDILSLSKTRKAPTEKDALIFIDTLKKFQTIVGIGGALTDAAAETFYKLPATKQQELINAYFNPQSGIGYTLARTNMQSCDFSSDMYTYVSDGDAALKTFSVTHDEKYKMPLIKEAMKVAKGKLSLFISPWSPPAWMKDNSSTLNGGKLLPAFAQSWANFYIKFIQAYKQQGIPVWGLTVQNEPLAQQKWESCIFTAEEERDFVKNYLGPALHNNGFSNKKLIIWDHNRDLIFQRTATVLADKQAAKYVWGIGYHWYETWTGGPMQFDNVRRVAESFPEKHLIFTEGCTEKFDASKMDNWEHGEKYGISMINDLNCGVVGWSDWNILLDQNGGPNHVGNYCFAPVHANTQTGDITYTNAYYYIGQFSKFIRPGAKRVACSSNRSQLATTAFINTDGKLAVVILNVTDDSVNYQLSLDGYIASSTILPHAIATLIVDK